MSKFMTISFTNQVLGRWLTVLGVVLFLGSSHPARAEEVWETALRLQLEAEKKCELAVIISVRQIPIGGLDGMEGRVRCVDTREFDFSQQRPHQKFTLQLCQPAVC